MRTTHFNKSDILSRRYFGPRQHRGDSGPAQRLRIETVMGCGFQTQPLINIISILHDVDLQISSYFFSAYAEMTCRRNPADTRCWPDVNSLLG